MKKIKKLFSKLSNQLFYGKYKNEMQYMNQSSNMKEYLLKLVLCMAVFFALYYLLFEEVVISILFTFLTTLFYVNQVYLNKKKIQYENYLLSEFSSYTSQTAMLMNFNNVYQSLAKVTDFLNEPLKSSLLSVIENMKQNQPLQKCFEPFHKKYNHRILTQFNKALIIFSENRRFRSIHDASYNE